MTGKDFEAHWEASGKAEFESRVLIKLAKELFNIDISGCEVKWDNLFKDYYFVKGKETVLQAALDAEKKPVYIRTSK